MLAFIHCAVFVIAGNTVRRIETIGYILIPRNTSVHFNRKSNQIAINDRAIDDDNIAVKSLWLFSIAQSTRERELEFCNTQNIDRYLNIRKREEEKRGNEEEGKERGR